MDRRAAVAGVLGAAALGAAGLPRPALAQGGFPAKPIRLVLGFAPGGVADIVARLVAPRLSESLGQPVVIDNRPGAGGIVAAENVARSAPDGYTWFWATSGTVTSIASFRSLPYDPWRDFAYLSTVSYFDHIIAKAPDFAPAVATALRAYARANPGRLNIGSIGVGNAQNLGAELLKAQLGVEATVVTYRGTPELLNACATGEVQLASEILPAVLAQLNGGRVKGLLLAAPQRFPRLPELPTAAEAGLPDYVVRSFNGVVLPAGTPQPILDRIHAEIVRAVADPGLRGRLFDLGATPGTMAPEELRTFFQGEVARWNRVIDAAHIERQ